MKVRRIKMGETAAHPQDQKEQKEVTVWIMGKAYRVPGNLTILRALETAGYRVVRGAGCRAGFCGACATVYRLPGDYKLHVALACQGVVQDGMHIMQIPYYPSLKERYDITKLLPETASITALYPQVWRCVACNTCTKTCPQDLKVMDYIQAVIRGDLAECADLSFDCVMCGLCATRCPAEIPQFLVAILARRLYGKYIAPRAEHVRHRIKEINEGKFDEEIKRLMEADEETLRSLYAAREIEK